MSRRVATAWIVAVSLVLGCSDGDSGSGHPVPPPALEVEAGFLDVAPRTASLRDREVRIDATARLFYSFHPADHGAADAPLFVLFNGFAAEIVRGYGTGPMTVVEGGDVEPNAASLTRVANLLYVDPRQSEFSYDVLDGRAPDARDCSPDVFNEYVDGADVLLGVLAFLDAHPSFRGQVVWVGESYAGVRIQWILSFLRGRWGLSDYHDATLEAAIAKSSRPSSLLAGQLLLEPWLVGGAHADAIQAACDDPELVAAVAKEVGASCAGLGACGCADQHDRSPYDFAYSNARQSKREFEAAAVNVDPAKAKALLGVALESIDGLAARDRSKGFKCSPPDVTTPSDAALVDLLGALPAGQSYYVPFSPLQPGKETAPTMPDWDTQDFEGFAFVDNLADVPAFVTNGGRDLVVPERALAPALARIVGADGVDAASPGKLGVKTPKGVRSIGIGAYPRAGHMITMIEPDAFANDVRAWLSDHGL